MIRIFIGSHKRFERCEPVIEYSIRKHASEPVEINFLRPEYYGMPDSGCTGFSKMRYEIPRICNYQGHAIYLDVDMILMADIAELWSYRGDYCNSTLKDCSDEVCVIDCEYWMRESKKPSGTSFSYHSHPIIDYEWNCEDWKYPLWKIEDAKIIHFTDLKCQPWFYEHPHPELAKIWFDLEKEAIESKRTDVYCTDEKKCGLYIKAE